nr:MAG TPA: hypothetical protein [Caudoviricetes sp.]
MILQRYALTHRNKTVCPSYSAFRKTLIFTHKEKRKFLYYKKKFLV